MEEDIIYSNIQTKNSCPPPELPEFTVSCSGVSGEYCCPNGWSCDPDDSICSYGGCCPP